MNDTPREDRPDRGDGGARRPQGTGRGAGAPRRSRDDQQRGGPRRPDGDRRGAPRREGGNGRRGDEQRGTGGRESTGGRDGGRRDGTAHGGDRGRRDERHAGARGGAYPARGGQQRPARPERPRDPNRAPDPEIPEDVDSRQLSKEARGRLRGLSKDNAEGVGAHLVMAGRLLDTDPEEAYLHAQAAVRRAGRIDVVREAAGIAAYRTGRYAEALRELRTVRRLNGSSEHLPLMADAERGLGRPERAIALAQSEEAATLEPEARTELAIVVSGARSDLGDHEAALTVLGRIPAAERQGDLGLRVLQARAVALETAGRADEATELLAGVDPSALERALGNGDGDEDYVVYDVFDETADDGETEA
ncbi:hypothetical protein UQW22_16065 [Isoptericola halotolerans]|uniref:hypothetical protein n=1 Tax=Isoptericola halotolerans TaxID=300560 RepID=UPI0038903448